MERTNEQLQEKFKTLPKDIQGLVLDEDFGPTVTFLCDEVGIDATKALDVEDEVFDVLMGFSHPKDFIRNIQSKIGIDQEKAKVIAEKVNEEIFQPVRESLKIVHNITEVASEASLASTASGALTQPITSKSPTPPSPTTPKVRPPVFPEIIVPRPSQASEASIASTPKPPEPPKAQQNIFEQKLQGMYKMPKEETLVPPKSSSIHPPQPLHPGGVDPYREQPK